MNIPFVNDDRPTGDRPQPALDAESIVLEEFRHNNVLLYQHRESINTLFNLYLALAGVLTSGIGVALFAYNQDAMKNRLVLVAIAFLLGGFSVLSFAFYAIFQNLRVAYEDSLNALDVIRDFYVDYFRHSFPELPRAFYWLKSPQRHRLGGDSRVMNWTTRAVGSYSLGQGAWVALIFVFDHTAFQIPGQFTGYEPWIKFIVSFALGVIAFVLYRALYRRFGTPPRVYDVPDVPAAHQA
jgi:hypothetical protein